jgi:hypothetical protein
VQFRIWGEICGTTECVSEQLAPKTDSESRPAELDDCCKKLLLVLEVGIGLRVIGTHFTTENNDRLNIFRFRQWITTEEADGLEHYLLGRCDSLQMARRNISVVPEDVNHKRTGHGGRLSLSSWGDR